ncbi:uncharacterized protein LOC143461765 isoform X2 [Clavelina lepadiformis]|uniref:uncharacterized protein LOC143461765 isoform X2 n=1 Tax=Clavelina lepadiformis TaxID=159417 RepID=UPI0040415E40
MSPSCLQVYSITEDHKRQFARVLSGECHEMLHISHCVKEHIFGFAKKAKRKFARKTTEEKAHKEFLS